MPGVNRVTAGQPIGKNPLGVATVINDVLDSVDDFKRRRMGDPTQVPDGFVDTNGGKVKNGTGSDLAAGAVVQLGTPLVTTLTNRFLWFNANTVSGTNPNSRYAILTKPIKSNAIGPAQMTGICIASVNVNAITDAFASPVASQTYLSSSSSGIAEILSPLSTTGVQLCAVRLSILPQNQYLAKLTATGLTNNILLLGNSAQFNIWTGAAGSESDSGVTINATARFEPCDKTGFAWLGNNGSNWYVIESEHMAGLIFGTLAGTLLPSGSVSCTVASGQNGKLPSSPVTCYDGTGTMSGTSGVGFVAAYDRYAGKYDLIGVGC